MQRKVHFLGGIIFPSQTSLDRDINKGSMLHCIVIFLRMTGKKNSQCSWILKVFFCSIILRSHCFEFTRELHYVKLNSSFIKHDWNLKFFNGDYFRVSICVVSQVASRLTLFQRCDLTTPLKWTSKLISCIAITFYLVYVVYSTTLLQFSAPSRALHCCL